MRRRFYLVALSVLAALLLPMTVASAQPSYVVVGQIPFAFHVGNATLPAGQYTVKVQSNPTGAIWIHSLDNSRNAVALTAPLSQIKKEGAPKLVFTKYDNDYFLSEVWDENSASGEGLFKTKAERELAANIRSAHAAEVAMGK